MHVIATAGHVDHGKSTLVKALTGMEPDRWAEERRRGLTIDLGFAWTQLPSGETVAFVDVPGHERFVPNMLAGLGPVPAALFVVAADEGWMPQSAEHLDALHALGVRHGLLAVTRSDLADPALATGEALDEIGRTSLGEVDSVQVSASTGLGMDSMRSALDRLVAGLPPPDLDAPVRLWIDRSFSIRGAGTVVTGTLAAGRVRIGDELEASVGDQLTSSRAALRIRGLHSLGEPISEAQAVARVAVNLRGVDANGLNRGDALLSPGRFRRGEVVDARIHGDDAASLPRVVTLHIGSASVTARVRPLGAETLRLALRRPLPLRIGDRGLLRDPGRHHVSGGLTVLDVDPPQLNRRGDAAARAEVLAGMDGRPDEDAEVRRRGLVRRDDLARMGVSVTRSAVADDWLVDIRLWARLRAQLEEVVAQTEREQPLEPGVPVDVARQALGLPDRSLVHALVESSPPAATEHGCAASAYEGPAGTDPAGPVAAGSTPACCGQTGPDRSAGEPASVSQPLTIRDGRIVRSGADGGPDLPPAVAKAIEALRADLATAPFVAPEAERLAELGLGRRELAAAERAGHVVRLSDGVVLAPEAVDEAVRVLASLSAPFTVSAARTALGTTRRVAVPLLEYLDRRGFTRRNPDSSRVVDDASWLPWHAG